MSELSDSVHVLDGETDAVVASLRAIEATALVLPRAGRHVTVLIRPSDVGRWSAVSTRPLLLWRFAADHEIALALHASGERRATLARATWPAATNPTSPIPVATRRLRVSFEARASERGPLMVRVVPGASAEGRGRFAVGRPIELRHR